jgi:hypothetical protein
VPGHAGLAVSARCAGSELAAFADLINNAAGASIGGEPAGCDLHVAAAALLARVLAALPAQPQPQLLADILQLEGAVRGERCLSDVHSMQHQRHGCVHFLMRASR